jgi:protein-arginine kinase activator protein McsA
MSEAGIIMEDKADEMLEGQAEESAIAEDESEYTKLGLEELKELLQKAIEKEEYEKASSIRDEINKRKKS